MTIRRSVLRSGRPLVGLVVLAVLGWRLGTGPFLHAVERISGWPVAAALALGAVATLGCAWRWTSVARGLGLELSLREAVTACYRSQFLNSVVPGGVVGDLHRGAVHGRSEGRLGLGLRAVLWERTSGQVVQAGLTLVVLAVLPSPLRRWLPLAVVVLLAVLAMSVALVRRPGRRSWARAVRDDVRRGVLAPEAWPSVVAASTLVVAAHTGTLLIAARVAGVTPPTLRLIPLALLVLAAASIPANLAGWGPREGAAAWIFALAGLGAAVGLATAVVYGVLALVATLPGAIVVLVGFGSRSASPRPAVQDPVPAHAAASRREVVRG